MTTVVDEKLTVWIVESSTEYTDAYTFLVAETLDAAVQGIFDKFPLPYQVRWDQLSEEGDDHASLVGNFEQVIGYSTKHKAFFEIKLWPVIPEPVPFEDTVRVIESAG